MARSLVRRIAEGDVAAAVALVHELADYERAPEECRLTEAQLRRALFGESPALFGHVAQLDGEVVGFALWYLSYSTWLGTHGVYLEDLYVRPGHRRAGLGGLLLRTLAQLCVERGYGRLEWAVLDWNAPAIDFYRSLGSEPMDGWTLHRLAGDALEALAGR